MDSNFCRYIVLGVFLCFGVLLYAHPLLVILSIDSKDVLSENRVCTILQFQDGRMFTTTEGISNIYDGTSFK